MSNDYSLSIKSTAFYQGEYKETTSYRELNTDSFLDAYKKYEDAVKERAEHVAILTDVKLDVVIQLACQGKVLNRIKLSN